MSQCCPGLLCPDRAVVVLGLMGAGKTTLAEALARRWVRPLRDSDADLLCEHGRSAAQLAAELGADSLHGLEATHLLRALADRPAPVIAAAASVVDRAECRRAVRDATVIWLDVPIGHLLARQASGGHRPAYRADLLGMLQDMDRARRSLFAAVAHIVLRHPEPDSDPGPVPVDRLVGDVEAALASGDCPPRANG